MMTPAEVIDLLTVITMYDRRTVGETDVHAWHDAAQRARWTLPEATEAAKKHFATSRDTWLMPGHITELIRTERRQPAPYQPRALRGGPLPATDQTRTTAMNEIRRILRRPDGASTPPVDPMGGVS